MVSVLWHVISTIRRKSQEKQLTLIMKVGMIQASQINPVGYTKNPANGPTKLNGLRVMMRHFLMAAS